MSFAYKKSITLDHTKVPNTDQTDFPVLISRTDTDLRSTGNGGHVQSSSGYDIGFYSDSGLTTAIPFKLIRYVASTGELIFRVKVTTLSHSSDTVIYMAYGDAGVTTDQSSNSTFNSAYKIFAPLEDGTTLSAADLTSNGNNGTITNATATTGKVGGGASFNGTNKVIAYPDLTLTDYTVSFWVNYASSIQNLFGSDNFSTSPRHGLMLDGSNQIEAYVGGTGGSANFTPPSTNTWHYVTMVRSGTTLSLYFDGNATAACTITVGSGSFTLPNIRLGAHYYFGANQDFGSGSVDEFRFSNTARSTDWMTAEYNNENSPSTFHTFGSETVTNVTTTKTTTAVSRIQKSVAQTNPGKSRITVATSQPTTGKGRVQKTTTQTASGKGDIQKATSRTNTGLGRLQKAVLQTISAILRVSGFGTQTTAGKSRITAPTQRTNPGVGRLQKLVNQTINAVSRLQRSVSQTVSAVTRIQVTTPTPTVYASDTFTDTDGTVITSHTPDAGGSWTSSGGNGSQWTIQTNKLSRTNAVIDHLYQDAGHADMEVSATFSSLQNLCSLLARRTDNSHYWELYFDFANNGWQLDRVNGADVNQGPLLPGTTGTVKLKCVGNLIIATGPNGDTWSVIDTFNNTATQAGLILDGFGGTPSTVDNWKVTNVPPQYITGKSSIQGSTTKTTTGVSSITIAITSTQTISGKGDIRKTTSRLIQAVARMVASVNKTVAGVGRMTATTLKTISAVSRVTITTLRAITGVTRVQKPANQTQTGLSRIQKTASANETGLARVSGYGIQPITAKGRITATTTQPITALGRIRRTVAQTINAISRIVTSATWNITGVARVTAATTRNNLGVSSIRRTTAATETGLSRIQRLVNATITAVSRLQKAANQTIAALSRIRVTTLRTNTGVSRIRQLVNQTLNALSRVQKAANQAILAVSRIQRSVPKTSTGKSRIQQTDLKNIVGLSRIQIVTARPITGVSRLYVTSTQQINGIAEVRNVVTRSIGGTSRIIPEITGPLHFEVDSGRLGVEINSGRLGVEIGVA